MVMDNSVRVVNESKLSENKTGNNNLLFKNLILIGLVILIAIAPLIFVKNAEFGGADGEAEGVIAKVNPEYEPWFNSIFEPASGEIESLLFALQAVIGAAVIFYYIGYNVGRKKASREN